MIHNGYKIITITSYNHQPEYYLNQENSKLNMDFINPEKLYGIKGYLFSFAVLFVPIKSSTTEKASPT